MLFFPPLVSLKEVWLTWELFKVPIISLWCWYSATFNLWKRIQVNVLLNLKTWAFLQTPPIVPLKSISVYNFFMGPKPFKGKYSHDEPELTLKTSTSFPIIWLFHKVVFTVHQNHYTPAPFFYSSCLLKGAHVLTIPRQTTAPKWPISKRFH